MCQMHIDSHRFLLARRQQTFLPLELSKRQHRRRGPRIRIAPVVRIEILSRISSGHSCAARGMHLVKKNIKKVAAVMQANDNKAREIRCAMVLKRLNRRVSPRSAHSSQQIAK
jgi:hypothetical protein